MTGPNKGMGMTKQTSGEGPETTTVVDFGSGETEPTAERAGESVENPESDASGEEGPLPEFDLMVGSEEGGSDLEDSGDLETATKREGPPDSIPYAKFRQSRKDRKDAMKEAATERAKRELLEQQLQQLEQKKDGIVRDLWGDFESPEKAARFDRQFVDVANQLQSEDSDTRALVQRIVARIKGDEMTFPQKTTAPEPNSTPAPKPESDGIQKAMAEKMLRREIADYLAGPAHVDSAYQRAIENGMVQTLGLDSLGSLDRDGLREAALQVIEENGWTPKQVQKQAKTRTAPVAKTRVEHGTEETAGEKPVRETKEPSTIREWTERGARIAAEALAERQRSA